MLNSVYCTFPPLIKVFLSSARLICRFDSCWESPCELFFELLVGVSRDQLAGRKGNAIGRLEMTSVVVFFV